MTLCLAGGSLREYRIGERRLLFHVPTTSLFEIDETAAAVMDQFIGEGSLSTEALMGRLAGAFSRQAVSEALSDLGALGVITAPGGNPPGREPPRVPDNALTTLVLGLTNGCNLACSYCYKEDLRRPADAQRMSADDARAAVDLLIRESGERPRINITFFGGEPLTALPTIRETVAHAEERAAASGKRVDFSITTNATLLDDHAIDFLVAHNVAVTVSMDGPAAIHDRNRRTVGGKGTYDVVADRARRLIERHTARPVGARVTLTGGDDIGAIHHHLKNEIGFAEVGFAPVTAGLPAGMLTPDLFVGMAELAGRWRDAALEGRDMGFSNISQMVGNLHEGVSKLIPCGAGLSLLAVETDGSLALCHRFIGSEIPKMGHVRHGIDRQAASQVISKALDRAAANCGDCHARHLCAGGCYHESHVRHGDMFRPTDHYCDLMRDWIDLGITIYGEIMAGNPSFLTRRHGPSETSS